MKKFDGFIKGINLGGWLSQSPLTTEHFQKFITNDDIQKISSMGFDHVRLPVDYKALSNYDVPALSGNGVEFLDRCVKWCSSCKINLLIDLHCTKGYSFSNPQTANSFFDNEDDMNFFISLWEEIAKRYGGFSHIAFELLNEMVLPNVQNKWNSLAGKAVFAIRRYASTPIVIGGVRYNHASSVKLITMPDAENIVFNFHCYEPFSFTHQGANWVEQMPNDFRIEFPDSYENQKSRLSEDIQQMLENNKAIGFDAEFFKMLFAEAVCHAKKHNAALYCGEYGVIDNGDTQSAKRWLIEINKAFDSYGIGRAAWTYKGMSFNMSDRGLLNSIL